MEEILDMIIVMVYPKGSNPIENVSHGAKSLSRMFHDHSSKYQINRGHTKCKTPKEIAQLINA